MIYSRRIAFLTWFSFLVFGFFEAVFSAHATALSLIHGLILILSAVFWCSYHAEQNDINIPKGAIVLCIIIPILGLPYYLFRGFGFKRGGLKFLLLCLFTTVSFATYLIPSELIGLLSS